MHWIYWTFIPLDQCYGTQQYKSQCELFNTCSVEIRAWFVDQGSGLPESALSNGALVPSVNWRSMVRWVHTCHHVETLWHDVGYHHTWKQGVCSKYMNMQHTMYVVKYGVAIYSKLQTHIRSIVCVWTSPLCSLACTCWEVGRQRNDPSTEPFNSSIALSLYWQWYMIHIRFDLHVYASWSHLWDLYSIQVYNIVSVLWNGRLPCIVFSLHVNLTCLPPWTKFLRFHVALAKM